MHRGNPGPLPSHEESQKCFCIKSTTTTSCVVDLDPETTCCLEGVKKFANDVWRTCGLENFIIIGVTVASDKAAKAFPYACAIQEASELNTALFGTVSKIFS